MYYVNFFFIPVSVGFSWMLISIPDSELPPVLSLASSEIYLGNCDWRHGRGLRVFGYNAKCCLPVRDPG